MLSAALAAPLQGPDTLRPLQAAFEGLASLLGQVANHPAVQSLRVYVGVGSSVVQLNQEIIRQKLRPVMMHDAINNLFVCGSYFGGDKGTN